MTQYLQNGLKDFKNILHINSLWYKDVLRQFWFRSEKITFFSKIFHCCKMRPDGPSGSHCGGGDILYPKSRKPTKNTSYITPPRFVQCKIAQNKYLFSTPLPLVYTSVYTTGSLVYCMALVGWPCRRGRRRAHPCCHVGRDGGRILACKHYIIQLVYSLITVISSSHIVDQKRCQNGQH